MEIKDLPKVNNEKELTETQKNDLFGNIIRGKDVTEKIETSRGTFEVKFPRMKDLEVIGRVLANRLNGIPVQSMDPNVYSLMSKIATLDIIVVSGPAWYENAKKDNGFTWGDIPVQSFIEEVHAKAFDFRLKVQELLERNSETENTGMVTGVGNDDVGNPGLFEGLSGSK